MNNPEKYRRERQQTIARDRARYRALSPVEQQAFRERNTRALRDQQDASRAAAVHHGHPYTEAEDAIVLASLPVRDIAARLGKTVQSVRSRRQYLRRHTQTHE